MIRLTGLQRVISGLFNEGGEGTLVIRLTPPSPATPRGQTPPPTALQMAPRAAIYCHSTLNYYPMRIRGNHCVA